MKTPKKKVNPDLVKLKRHIETSRILGQLEGARPSIVICLNSCEHLINVKGLIGIIDETIKYLESMIDS